MVLNGNSLVSRFCDIFLIECFHKKRDVEVVFLLAFSIASIPNIVLAEDERN